MEFPELPNRVIDCALEVHRRLSSELLEPSYEQCSYPLRVLRGETALCLGESRVASRFLFGCALQTAKSLIRQSVAKTTHRKDKLGVGGIIL